MLSCLLHYMQLHEQTLHYFRFFLAKPEKGLIPFKKQGKAPKEVGSNMSRDTDQASSGNSPLTRVTLIQRLRVQQDERSWQEFVTHYRGYIQRLAKRMGLNHHDSEEVVQNVCLKSWQALPTFAYDPGKGRFRGWLWQVTANEVRMLWRSRRRDPTIAVDAEEMAAHPDPSQRPEEVWAEQEWRAHITQVAWNNVRGEFEERTQRVFELLAQGRSAQSVAEEVGLAVSSIWVYRKRVQDRLRKEITRLNDVLD